MHSADSEDRAFSTLARLERRNAELEMLFDTIRDLTSTLSVDHVLGRLLHRTLAHLDSVIGSIMLLGSDGRLRIISAQGLPDEVVETTSMVIGEGISGWVAEHREPLLIEDIEEHPEFGRLNHERYNTRSLISCPLLLGEDLLGVVNVNNKQNALPFGPDDLRLLEAIAAHAAVALGNARRYEETLRRAQCDALTGLANHGHFFSNLELEIQRAQRYERDLTLVMIDIDWFKTYNDRFGHRVGDEALICVSRAIAGISRSHDLVARYGGEEFAVVLPETDLAGGQVFAEKIRQAVEASEFGSERGEPITVSVGIAPLTPECGSANSLVEAADAQLYRAKAEGRNCVCAPDRSL